MSVLFVFRMSSGAGTSFLVTSTCPTTRSTARASHCAMSRSKDATALLRNICAWTFALLGNEMSAFVRTLALSPFSSKSSSWSNGHEVQLDPCGIILSYPIQLDFPVCGALGPRARSTIARFTDGLIHCIPNAAAVALTQALYDLRHLRTALRLDFALRLFPRSFRRLALSKRQLAPKEQIRALRLFASTMDKMLEILREIRRGTCMSTRSDSTGR
ncbi:hypothetical protein BV25DRAFT_208454 [Artomyces pyxidatus]|uniref:Uncharacterized protein n=1 Tax=Artomyces pyxidatus TaxID=48021 RepID=A0ACB8T8V3_9AGAM|nr:hypothetical protein BV25DRAFT_208454 [Artomyces pyxidatus]